MNKKIVIFIIFLFFFSVFPLLPIFGQTNEKAVIHFFWSQGCPYCSAQKVFLEDLQKEYSQIEIKEYEFSKNIELVKELYEKYQVNPREQGLVPITFTENRYFVGFNEQIAKEIKECLQECLEDKAVPEKPRKIKIPLLGEINIENLSLPVLAITLGALDGFNVCSLGALILILSLVFVLKSKRKILIFGGIFVLTTVIVYGFLVFLWHQLFVFIAPHIKKMSFLLAFLALAGSIYFFREFLKSKKQGAACQFGGFSEKMSQKVQRVFERKTNILVLLGAVLLFATIVTVIEFPCTAFFPLLFAGILAEAKIHFYSVLFYIGLYIFFYMLDEVIILFLAVLTMKVWIASPKIMIFVNLFASILLFLLAFYYFFGLP